MNDHFILTSAYDEITVLVDCTDVACVEPVVFESLGSFGRRAEITGTHALAPNQNFTVGRDADADTGKRLPHGPGFKMERVIEAHNGRGLSKPVPLYNHKTQTAPELLRARSRAARRRRQSRRTSGRTIDGPCDNASGGGANANDLP